MGDKAEEGGNARQVVAEGEGRDKAVVDVNGEQ